MARQRKTIYFLVISVLLFFYLLLSLVVQSRLDVKSEPISLGSCDRHHGIKSKSSIIGDFKSISRRKEVSACQYANIYWNLWKVPHRLHMPEPGAGAQLFKGEPSILLVQNGKPNVIQDWDDNLRYAASSSPRQ